VPAPLGLSGGPLLAVEERNLILGVVYGTNAVERIESFARIDPETGERKFPSARLRGPVTGRIARAVSEWNALSQRPAVGVEDRPGSDPLSGECPSSVCSGSQPVADPVQGPVHTSEDGDGVFHTMAIC
jgi:hypothetical protein